MNTQESLLFDGELMEATFLWCYRHVSNTHDAEDLSQEILLEAIISYRKACGKGEPPAAFYPWFWGIAKNRLRLFYRSRKKQAVFLGASVGDLSDSEPYYFDLCDIDEALIAEEERARLTFELSLLSRIQRECVILYYLQNRSVKEIARILGIPEGTVKSRLFDARKNVKKGMEEPMENNETKNKRLSYAPAELNMCGSNNIPSHWHFLQDTMVKQILVACAYEGKTVREIAETIGVAPVYFEEKIDYLLKHKFIKEIAPSTYIDDFPIVPQQADVDMQVAANAIHLATMPRVTAIIRDLLPKVRKLILNEGDLSDGYLLWFLYVRAAWGMGNCMKKRYAEVCPHKVAENNGKSWRLFGRVTYPDDQITCKGEYKGMTWSNMHYHFRTAKHSITVANLYEAQPFSMSRDTLVTEGNADLVMRLWEDPHTVLTPNEQETAAHLIQNGFLVSRDGGIYLNIPVMTWDDTWKLDELYATALDGIAAEVVEDLIKVGDTYMLPHVRPDLLEEYVHYIMTLCFSCINELFWYGVNEGHDLEIPADYETSAAGMAVYIR
jgi:RNA polymerase sigma-70 factor (ECF subfamily)